MACPNKHRGLIAWNNWNENQLSEFIAEAAQTVRLASDSPCFPELKQYKNLRECGKEMCCCV